MGSSWRWGGVKGRFSDFWELDHFHFIDLFFKKGRGFFVLISQWVVECQGMEC